MRLVKILVYSLFLLSLSILSWIAIRGAFSYRLIKASKKGWEGAVFTIDSALGFVPRPYSNGYEVLSTGERIPVSFDSNGCRTVESRSIHSSNPVILFLGCSFTYGAACQTDETFAYLVGSKLGGVSVNAGVPSYGLAPMVIRGQQLIPTIKPDVVIVQFSPWLLTRSTQYYAPSYYGIVPTPYFITRNAKIEIAGPVFSTVIFDKPLTTYRISDRSTSDFLNFMVDVGIPMEWHDEWSILKTKFKVFLNPTLKPTQDTTAILKFAYGQLDSLTRTFGGRMIIININANQGEPATFHTALNTFERINVDSVLWSEIETSKYDDYLKKYGHWRGTSLIDTHPNATAHQLISDQIVTYLSAAQKSNPMQKAN